MKTAITIVVMLTLMLCAAVADQSPPPAPSQEQPEVLTRGPVHEAYAEPVDLQIQAGIVAPKQPPANIQEAPTTQMPQGGNFVWVGGYWAWDADRNDYIWVSGCWRAAPPGMSWVPGYWAQVSNGWEWVAGFWTPAGTKEIQYLPPPPDLGNVEAMIPAPSPDYVWVPPCQYWYNGGYVLRAGYWLTPQPNWVWVPSHYVWTPRGYVFVDGHWDYPFSNRGVLFAPVYFHRPIYFQSAFIFSPSIVLDIGAIQIGLFAYPRYCHYYFGDYYDDVYIRVGIYPWFECERYHTWYDPIYFHDRWRYRNNPHWVQEQRHEFDMRRNDRDLRPPRTYREMETRLARAPESQRKNLRIAEPLNTYAKTSHVKFQQADTKTQKKFAAQAGDVRKYSAKRSSWESSGPTPKAGQPAVEHRTTVPAEQGRRPVTAPERTAPAVQTQPGRQVTPAPERQAPAVTAPTPKEQVTPPQRQAPAAPPSVGRKEQIPATPQRQAPATESKHEVTTPAEAKPEYVPPREVHAKSAERVKVPESSIVGKPGASEKGPPSRPANEHQNRGEQKDVPKGQAKDNQRTGDTGDKNKGRSK